jgi:hypothetical protein
VAHFSLHACIGPRVEKEFQGESIVEGLYALLKEVSEMDDECQLIVVDNHPPEYMRDDVRVYYSRNPQKPPYGFIDVKHLDYQKVKP